LAPAWARAFSAQVPQAIEFAPSAASDTPVRAWAVAADATAGAVNPSPAAITAAAIAAVIFRINNPP